MISQFFSPFVRQHWRTILGIGCLVGLVGLVYSPVIPGSFVMDDRRLIGADNPLVNGSLNPGNLWFQTDFTLATFGWWLEVKAFGDQPLGYHLVNLFLHAGSCLLLWRLLAVLKIPGAWLAAALFAVHPVCVNTVARVAELKNTLSLPFYLLSLLAFVRFDSLAAERAPSAERSASARAPTTLWFGVALISFVLALLAKTTVIMLPVVLFFYIVWQRRRVARLDLIHLSPFLALALAFGLMSIWFQKHQALTTTELALPTTTLLGRLANAGYVFWFYLGKSLLPIHLNLVYPLWQVNPAQLLSYLPDLLALGLFAVFWLFRKSWGGHALFALAVYTVTLLPALGLVDAQFLTLWRVSDHLQYLPLVSVLALVAAGITVGIARAHRLPYWHFIIGLLVAMLALATYQRAECFRSEESLMRDTLTKNPSAWSARNDLGVILASKGDLPAAFSEFTLSLQQNPDNESTRMNLVRALLLMHRFSEAQNQLTLAFNANPLDPQAHNEEGELAQSLGRNDTAIAHFKIANALQPSADRDVEIASLDLAGGQTGDAVHQLRRAVRQKPDDLIALNDLAWVLATNPEAAIRNGSEALMDATTACRATRFRRPELLSVLAAAYAETGNFAAAINTTQLAMNLARQSGNEQLVTANANLLASFEAGKPWRN